jgi:hypothetical protein
VDSILEQPATSPALCSMTLVSNLLPYPITVHSGLVAYPPSPYFGTPMGIPSGFVTVRDVLTALYIFLRRPMSVAEVAALYPFGQAAWLALAFQSRVLRITNDGERLLEHQKGVKRIDMLIAAGKTLFSGLTATKDPHTWALVLD